MEKITRGREKLVGEWLIESNVYDEVRDAVELFTISRYYKIQENGRCTQEFLVSMNRGY